MTTPEDERAEEDPSVQPLAAAIHARSRRRDLAKLLPVAGIVFLMSPLIDIAGRAGMAFGIPASVLYVFGVWAILILGAALLSGRLRDDCDHE